MSNARDGDIFLLVNALSNKTKKTIVLPMSSVHLLIEHPKKKNQTVAILNNSKKINLLHSVSELFQIIYDVKKGK